MTRPILIRIPRKLVEVENRETLCIRFPDGESLIRGILMELANDDPTRCVMMSLEGKE